MHWSYVHVHTSHHSPYHLYPPPRSPSSLSSFSSPPPLISFAACSPLPLCGTNCPSPVSGATCGSNGVWTLSRNVDLGEIGYVACPLTINGFSFFSSFRLCSSPSSFFFPPLFIAFSRHPFFHSRPRDLSSCRSSPPPRRPPHTQVISPPLTHASSK